jgi:hypothetical protein
MDGFGAAGMTIVILLALLAAGLFAGMGGRSR